MKKGRGESKERGEKEREERGEKREGRKVDVSEFGEAFGSEVRKERGESIDK
jgi:hypothetical protein